MARKITPSVGLARICRAMKILQGVAYSPDWQKQGMDFESCDRLRKEYRYLWDHISSMQWQLEKLQGEED